MSVDFLFIALIAGVIATIGMTAFMETFYKVGVLRSNAIQAIGSFVTQSMAQSMPVGWLIHTVAGMAFALLYTFVIFESAIVERGVMPTVMFSSMLGFSHGLIVSFFVVISVGEHHPIRRFRSEGIGMAALYVAAHIVYGGLIGLVIGMSGISTTAASY